MVRILGVSGLLTALGGVLLLVVRAWPRTIAATRRLLRGIGRRARESTADEAASDPGSEALAMDLEVRDEPDERPPGVAERTAIGQMVMATFPRARPSTRY